jgi:kinesin family protein 15
MLSVGMANRRVAETLANDRSSRSHSVFTANIVQKLKDTSGSVSVLRSRLHLVDLAGSERQKASGAAGERLKEASSINKSLSALGLVIMSLVDQQQGKQRHVPYRDSKLTYLLQDALGGRAKTVLLATISPASANSSETLSTLRFADNAKRIKNRAIINQDAEGDPEELRKEVLRLREELSNLRLQTSQNPQLFQNVENQTPINSIHNNPLGDPSNSVDGVRAEGIRKALVASLKREEDMSRAVAALKEEVIAMENLLTSKDADLRRTSMILKLKESRLSRQEAHRSKDEDMKALECELSLLKERNESHPEVKRFALENVRMKRQIDQANFGGSHEMPGVSEEEFAVLRREMLQVAKVAEEAQEELESIRAQAEAAKHVYQDTESKRRESIIRDMDGAGRLEVILSRQVCPKFVMYYLNIITCEIVMSCSL